MAKIIKYCLGFAFYKNNVILIKKTRPAFQLNLLNGVGGKIEYGETPHQSMVREFHEETGAITDEDRWALHGKLFGPELVDVEVYIFYINLDSYQYSEILRSIHNKGNVGEIVTPINFYFELDMLEIESKLLYNVYDIVRELIPLAKGDELNRKIVNDTPFKSRIIKICSH